MHACMHLCRVRRQLWLSRQTPDPPADGNGRRLAAGVIEAAPPFVARGKLAGLGVGRERRGWSERIVVVSSRLLWVPPPSCRQHSPRHYLRVALSSPGTVAGGKRMGRRAALRHRSSVFRHDAFFGGCEPLVGKSPARRPSLPPCQRLINPS